MRDARSHHPWGIGGFTLVELLVTVVCASILLALAVPAFRTFVQNDRQWLQQSSLVMSLNAARSEAIKQDLPVQVCTSANGATCDFGPWTEGWIVLSSAGGNPVQVVGALPAGTTLTEANNNTSVTFLSNGTLGALTNPEPKVEFKMCDNRGAAQAHYTQVTLFGRVVSSTQVGKDLAGANLTCP